MGLFVHSRQFCSQDQMIGTGVIENSRELSNGSDRRKFDLNRLCLMSIVNGSMAEILHGCPW